MSARRLWGSSSRFLAFHASQRLALVMNQAWRCTRATQGQPKVNPRSTQGLPKSYPRASFQGGDGRSGGLLRRVEERDIAKQCEAGLVRNGIRRLCWRHLFESDRDHPESVRVELCGCLLSLGKVALIEGAGLAVDRIG